MVDEDVTAVIHFSARKQVGESVARPTWYYQQNIGGMANVLAAMEDTGVDQMIFSSSAAVYGIPTAEVVTEDMAGHPINPYGETKLIGEWMMADCERAWDLKWIGLRYFNVAGAGWPDLADPAIMNLIPMVLDRIERGESAKIFGTDYDTPDGTCVRDYIHVLDLAEAHIAALDVLAEGRQPDHHTYNVGTGLGTSVREIIDGLRRVIGWDFPVEELDRRAGDPPKLIGDPLSIGPGVEGQQRPRRNPDLRLGGLAGGPAPDHRPRCLSTRTAHASPAAILKKDTRPDFRIGGRARPRRRRPG